MFLIGGGEGIPVIGSPANSIYFFTNLGAYGIDAFTPIINPGQTAILGVGRISERAVVYEGKIEIRPTCVLSLTFDHRLVDGAPAAKFLNALKESVESNS